MAAIGFYIYYIFIWTVTLLPLRVLYILSDLSFFLIYYVIRYRRKVVLENLKNSFPEKGEDEIRKIARKYYRFLGDYWLETMKILHISDEEMKRRCRFKNMDYVESMYKQGRSVLAFMGHYGNWEWIPSISINSQYTCGGVYRPMKNPWFDNFFLKIRSRFGNFNMPMKKTFRIMMEYHKKGIPTFSGFIADQTPGKNKIQHWTRFLNQDTPVLTGGEKIAQKMDLVVVYVKMIRVKRGYYEVDIIPMFENAKDTQPHEITERYIQLLEAHIRQEPQYWLWSHRRWKHKRTH